MSGTSVNPAWSDKMDDLLVESRIKLGLSFSQTSRRLTDHIGRPITRSACICRARRKGMCKPANVRPQSDNNTMARRIEARSAPNPTETHASIAEPISTPHAKPWIEREDGECKWTISDNGPAADWKSCCAPTAKSGYCAGHHAIMYRASDSTEDFTPSSRTPLNFRREPA